MFDSDEGSVEAVGITIRGSFLFHFNYARALDAM